MIEKPLGIYYLEYAEKPFPRSARKLIFGYEKKQLLREIKKHNIDEKWFCWLQECRTPGYLVEGDVIKIKVWVSKHMPSKFGEPLRD
jgi:hypothetical protein